MTTDPHKPLPPDQKQPDAVPSDSPGPGVSKVPPDEGPLPDLTPTTDPLLQPMPRPAPREVPPAD